MKIFVLSNFRSDLDTGNFPELLLDDIVAIAEDGSTVIESDQLKAFQKLMDKKYLYTITIERTLNAKER